jgi:hypothetical protein
MNDKKNLWKMFLVLGAMLVMASPVRAGSYSFDFLSSDQSYNVIGTITTASATNGISNGSSLGYSITGISGSVNGANGGSITSLVSDPSAPNMVTDYGIGFMYDNVLFPATSPNLDIGGVVFTAGNGSIWNLWANAAQGPGNYELFSWTAAGGSVGDWGHAVQEFGDLTITSPIPEPKTYMMLLAGLGLMGFLALRRQQEMLIPG